MVLLSAKLQIFVFSIKGKRSLINILNNNGLKIEPCRMPQAISYQALFEEPIFFFVFDVIRNY